MSMARENFPHSDAKHLSLLRQCKNKERRSGLREAILGFGPEVCDLTVDGCTSSGGNGNELSSVDGKTNGRSDYAGSGAERPEFLPGFGIKRECIAFQVTAKNQISSGR